MSEWIDFAIYALQVVLFGVFLTRQSVQFTVPAIVDRDPAWPAAHPQVIDAIARSRWFLNTFYVWAALSIGVLLALRLGWVPTAAEVGQPSWRILMRAHATLLTVGVLGYLACFWYWTRWLAASVPLAAQRRATLKPRVSSDYVPRAWRIATEALTAAQLALWLALPGFGLGGDGRYWRTFAFVVTLTVLLAVLEYWTARRRPNYGDRLFGERYRRMELRVFCLARVAVPIAVAVRAYGEAITGVETERVVQLVVMLFCSALTLAFLRLQPVAPPSPRSGLESRFGV